MAEWVYTATWECGETIPPRTIRGDVEAGSFHGAAAKAAKASRKQLGTIRPTTLVVLIERKPK